MAVRFLDIASIHVTAGAGGDGCRSLHKPYGARYRRADGGHGGDGGHVIVHATWAVGTLQDCAYRRHYRATSGGHGGGNGRQGARGEDAVALVPVGTFVRDADTGELLRDLARADESVIVARGGRGGRGNIGRREATPGTAGVARALALELKLVADVGLVGLPNAGKSSLLQSLSSARPKVAPYPFTTVSPNLGMVVVDEVHAPLTVCDIPGLIEGAHAGRGLGLTFLRHVERTRLLVFVVDMAGTDGRQPVDDLCTLQDELAAYASTVGEKPRIIAANKMDMPAAAAQLVTLQRAMPDALICPMSCVTGDGIPELSHAMASQLLEVP